MTVLLLHGFDHCYKQEYWEDRLTDEQLEELTVSSDHVQRVDDLEIFHVRFASPEETAEMWWRVLIGEQPDS